jgi:histidine phosphotransferase ChpT
MAEKSDLAALIGSRICHDLISPIGAIGNGVELMMMEGGGQSAELSLISESVANANARIRYFRVAFGAASTDQRIARSEIMSILTDLSRGGRLIYAWDSGPDLARRDVRLAFQLLLCLETAMAYGGRIRVEHSESSWQITAEAARLKADPVLWASLTDTRTEVEIGPGQVQFALVPEELQRQGRRLVLALSETTIRLSF